MPIVNGWIGCMWVISYKIRTKNFNDRGKLLCDNIKQKRWKQNYLSLYVQLCIKYTHRSNFESKYAKLIVIVLSLYTFVFHLKLPEWVGTF